jgi:hypothetical protein
MGNSVPLLRPPVVRRPGGTSCQPEPCGEGGDEQDEKRRRPQHRRCCKKHASNEVARQLRSTSPIQVKRCSDVPTTRPSYSNVMQRAAARLKGGALTITHVGLAAEGVTIVLGPLKQVGLPPLLANVRALAIDARPLHTGRASEPSETHRSTMRKSEQGRRAPSSSRTYPRSTVWSRRPLPAGSSPS